MIGRSPVTVAGTAVLYSIPDVPRFLNSVSSVTNANQIGLTWENGLSTGGRSITKYSIEYAKEGEVYKSL